MSVAEIRTSELLIDEPGAGVSRIRVFDAGHARCPESDVAWIREVLNSRGDVVALRTELLSVYDGYLDSGGPLGVWIKHLEDLVKQGYTLVGRTVALRKAEGVPPRFYVECKERKRWLSRREGSLGSGG